MSSPLDEQAMSQLQSQQSELLDKIDELRAIGVGGLVELPQIIVCGNQSSGKSSVLEAISRVRFPSKSNICTRFATEIVLRRSLHDRIKVSIEPGDSRKDEQEKQKLRAFTSESFSSAEDLPTLIEKAKECMGLSSTDPSSTGFSDDVLKVEISGPEKPELTLVDLPGLYYSSSSEQNEQGMEIVQKLTEKYIKSSRSIILAVISARADYHIQKVLNIAQSFDPKYERVLGIVTQPDIPEAGSDEQETYLQFIKNEKVKLQLGWHVLRNRSFETRSISDDARDVQEKEFFERGRWASLPRDQVGIESLRHRLSKILLGHVRRNLPGLIADIQERISRNEQTLAKMGAPRATLQEQRHFLVDISSRFARITNQALNGSYVDEFFGGFKDHAATTEEAPFRRLRAIIRELNECFAEAMSIRGNRRIIKFPGEPAAIEDVEKERSKPYMDDWTPQYISQESLVDEIKEQARQSRGIELPGSANQLLVGSLFRDQCGPWEAVAKSHLLNTWDSVEYFIQLVLKNLTDDHTRPLLMRHLIGPEMEKMKESLLAKLGELTSYTKRGHPLPVGQSFLAKIQGSRKNRQVSALKRYLNLSSSYPPTGEGTQNTFDVRDLERATSQLQSSSDQFAATEIIDQMQAYYETAIVTFVDNVAILAIENCLLCPLEHIFTGKTVLDMDDQQIREIAAEPLNIQKDRERLNEELEKLRKGRQTLNAFSIADSALRARPILAGLSTPRAQTPSLAATAPIAQVAPITPRPGLFPQVSTPATAPVASPLPIFPSNQNRGGFGTTQGSLFSPSLGSAENGGIRPNNGATATSSLFTSPPATKWPAGNVSGSTVTGGFGSNNQGFGSSKGFGSSLPLGGSTNSTTTKDVKPRFDAKRLPETQGFRDMYHEKDVSSYFSTINWYQSICLTSPFMNYSYEELRLGDYARRNQYVPT
ncbi:Dynamin [Penicillium italicum]|uniref:Dynamin n=1 Tax=Penicillium italicum TaxID=40296 RepID=A0A0A2KGK9_PENIT|nr:Dynamin [Penicillium italicum]